MTKRIIGLVLALCLVVGLLPMIALADETQAITSTLTVTTGNNNAKVQWKPTLSEGMAAAYAKTTAEGALVLDGATESDYNLKVEWETGKTPVLTLKNATLANDTEAIDGGASVVHTIRIDGDAAFTVMLMGTNTIKGGHAQIAAEKTNIANHRMAAGIYATNKGTLTIKSVNKTTDTLLIDNNGGNGLYKEYNALTIDSANVTIYQQTTDKNGQVGIVMVTGGTAYADLTNLTVINSVLSLKNIGRYYGNSFITMGKAGASYNAENTGDILFKNSTISFNRNNGTSVNSTSGNAIWYSPNGSMTIDRCDFSLLGNHRTFNYAPTVINCSGVQSKTNWSDWAEWTVAPGTALTANTNNSGLKGTHVCGSDTDDLDCTTATTCDMCGAAVGTPAAAHTPAADDGDCTTDVMCANAGCNVIVTPGAAAHTPEADDGDCTTAIKCPPCGTETTAAAAALTPADRASCDVAANCTVCGKETLKAGEHSGGTATCQAKAKCEECGQEYGELAPCAGGTATCQAKAKCDTCGNEYGELAAHTGGTATCKDKAVCTVCNQAYGELSTEHVPAEDDKDCSTAVACTICGGEAIAAKTHAFANSQDTDCDNEGCEHTRTVEPKPQFTFTFVDKGGNGPSSAGKATLIMKAGDPAKYYTTGQYDTANPNNWYVKETTDTTNWNMKVEYDADGIPTITLKGAKVQNRCGLEFGGWDAAYEGPTKVIIAEDSLIMNTVAYSGSYPGRSAMNFNTKGQNDDVTITCVGDAKLTIATNVAGETRGGISTTGNLILDHANIEIMTSEYNSCSQGIAVIGGNLTIKGGNLKISGYDDASTLHSPGKETGYTRNQAAVFSGLLVTKDAANEAKAGNIIIEDGAKVSIAVSTKACSTPVNNNAQAIYQDGTFTIKESEVEIGLVGKCADTSKLFLAKPVLEYANGYTVTATKTKKPTVTKTVFTEANDSTYRVEMTPDLSKAVVWEETTSLGSITYFKVVAGGSGSGTGTGSGTGSGTGTGTTPSNPNTGDVSVLLTAAIALSSAVGFAGVTVLRKKEF